VAALTLKLGPRQMFKGQGAHIGSAPTKDTPTVGDIVRWFKTMTTNEYIRAVKQSDWAPFVGKAWQAPLRHESALRQNVIGGARRIGTPPIFPSPHPILSQRERDWRV